MRYEILVARYLGKNNKLINVREINEIVEDIELWKEQEIERAKKYYGTIESIDLNYKILTK